MAPDTDCLVCLGVAAGGRIRLTDKGAELIEMLLKDNFETTMEGRRVVKDAGGVVTIYNERTALIRQLLGEIERTQIEMGWLDGQPQRTHT